jgi:hypothetical protein
VKPSVALDLVRMPRRVDLDAFATQHVTHLLLADDASLAAQNHAFGHNEPLLDHKALFEHRHGDVSVFGVLDLTRVGIRVGHVDLMGLEEVGMHRDQPFDLLEVDRLGQPCRAVAAQPRIDAQLLFGADHLGSVATEMAIRGRGNGIYVRRVEGHG